MTLREELEAILAAFEHRGATYPEPAGSAHLLCAQDLRRIITKHFPLTDVDLARHATTEPGEPPGEIEEEPMSLPSMKHPRPLPTIEES